MKNKTIQWTPTGPVSILKILLHWISGKNMAILFILILYLVRLNLASSGACEFKTSYFAPVCL
jgi:hypothetical protein